MTIIWSYYCSIKGTHHLNDLTPHEISHALFMNWVAQTVCIAAAAASKVAVALLIARIQSKNFWRSLLLWIISGLSVLGGVFVIFLQWFQCTPVKGLWDLDVRQKCLPAAVTRAQSLWVSCKYFPTKDPLEEHAEVVSCLGYSRSLTRCYSCTYDMVSLNTQFWFQADSQRHLQMPTKRKVILSAMLGCGVL